MVNHLIRNLLTAADPGFSGQFSLEEVAKLIESGIVLGSTSTRNSCYQLHTEAFYSYHFVALSLDNASPAGRLILYGQIQRSIRSAIQYKQADHRNLWKPGGRSDVTSSQGNDRGASYVPHDRIVRIQQSTQSRGPP